LETSLGLSASPATTTATSASNTTTCSSNATAKTSGSQTSATAPGTRSRSTAEGFVYFIPALVRLALADPDPYWGWYGAYFIFHMAGDGPFNQRWAACTPDQRRAAHAVLCHILESRASLVDEDYASERLLQAIDVWSVFEDLSEDGG